MNDVIEADAKLMDDENKCLAYSQTERWSNDVIKMTRH